MYAHAACIILQMFETWKCAYKNGDALSIAFSLSVSHALCLSIWLSIPLAVVPVNVSGCSIKVQIITQMSCDRELLNGYQLSIGAYPACPVWIYDRVWQVHDYINFS